MSRAAEKVITKLATVAGVDATSTGATTLYNVPVGKKAIIDHVVIQVTSFTAGSKATQAVASFGGNSATFDDYLNSVTYTVAAQDVYIKDTVVDTAVTLQDAGDAFSIIIETASDATTEEYTIHVFGYLV